MITRLRSRENNFSRSTGPSWFFRSRGTFASPLTGLRFQFRLEIPDPGFVISNHLLQKFVPFTQSATIVQFPNVDTCSSLRSCGTHRTAIGRSCKRSVNMRYADAREILAECAVSSRHSAVFLQDLEHTFHTLVISRCSGSSWLRVVLYAQPSLTKALTQREIVLRPTVSTPHTSISELWISLEFSRVMFQFWCTRADRH